MGLKIDRVQLDIIINNDQARTQLRGLEAEARKLTAEMNKMVRGSDDYVKKSAELTKVKAQMDNVYESIGTVNMTMRELSLRAKELAAIRQHLRPGTEEFQKIDTEIKQVTARMGELKGKAKETGDAIGNSGNEMGSIWGKATGIFAVASGAMASIYGVIKAGQAVIASSEALSDKWEKTVTGLTFGWENFKTSIATSDFSNLLTNMQRAIKAGREYAEVMDLLEDKRRGATVSESKAALELSQLRIVMNNVNLTDQARAAYTQIIIDKEKELANVRADINKTDLEATTNAIVAKKNISKVELENFIAFQGTTEEKVKLADEYNAKVERLASMNKVQAASYGYVAVKTKEEIAAQTKLAQEIQNTSSEVKAMGKVVKNISPAEIELLTQKTVDYYQAAASVSENVERYYKKQDGLEKNSEANITKQVKAVEKLRDEFAAMSTSDGKVISEFDYLELTNKARQKAIDLVEEETNALLELNDAQYSDQFANKFNAGAKTELNKVENEDEKKKRTEQMALDAAAVTSDAIFEIMRSRDQALLDAKLSDLEKEKNEKLKNTKLTAEQRDKIEADYNKKEAKLKTDAAKKGKATAIIQAIINTALAIMNALATGGPAAVPLSIAAGIAGAAQIAVITAQKVPQYYTGRNVTGALDGRQYTNVPYAGNARTGLYTHPTLIADHGSEIVIDHNRSRNIQMNYPEIMAAIRAVPQYYSGRYPGDQQPGVSTQQTEAINPALLSMLAENNRLLRILQQDGVQLSYQK
ncbi:MAG: hypothetical protein ACOYN4_11225, partial [Bacteroidales bacterium]